MKEPREIVRRALISEKGTQIRTSGNHYLFEVFRDSNKIEIKRAVEAIFGVKVERVRTLQVVGKTKRMGVFQGKRSDWKKAVVTLRKGDTIDIFEQI
ncbi:MAG: 50S ribosomal protein L23 [Candidatus Eisenbacteria bacterium]|nr:50S ribosomal protein L23 [Candidatus Eisenbacteria bacterium]